MNIGRIIGAGAVVLAAVVMATVPATPSQAQHRSRTVVVSGGSTCAQPVVGVSGGYGGTTVVSGHSTFGHGHVVKEYVPVAIPTAYPAVAVPVYSYVNAPGYVPGATYGSVLQGGSNDEKVADLVVEKLKKQGLVGPGVQPVAPTPPGGDTGGGPPAVKTGAKVDTSGFAAKAEALLTTKCATCHGGQAKAGGGYVFFDEAKKLVNLGAADRIEIYDSIYEGRMPKNGTPFTDQEVEWVRVWMKQK